MRTPERASLLAALRADGCDANEVGDDELTVRRFSPERLGSLAARAGIPLYGLAPENPSLEEIFFDLTDSKEEPR